MGDIHETQLLLLSIDEIMEGFDGTILGLSEDVTFWRTPPSSETPPRQISGATQPRTPKSSGMTVPSLPATQTSVLSESLGLVSSSTEEVESASRRVRKRKSSRGSSRSGRGGKLQCTPCRVAKKGWDCVAQDPSNPLAPPCTQCHNRGKPDDCDGRTWPEKRRRQNLEEIDDKSTHLTSDFTIFQSRVCAQLDDLSSKLTTLESQITKICALLLCRDRSVINLEYNRLLQSCIDNITDRDLLVSEMVDLTDVNRPATSPLPLEQVRRPASEHPLRNSATDGVQLVLRNFVTPNDLIRRQYTPPDFLEILEIISESIDQHRAIRIARYLEKYFQIQKRRITCLRTTSVAKFMNNRSFPPMIEWREGQDVDVLAFWKIPEGGGPCNFLMHAGVGFCLPNSRHWDRASIRWSVSDIAHLKELLSAAQHILGLLQWSHDDLKRLCIENCKASTADELRTTVDLLVAHELQMKELDASIDACTPLLEAASSKELIVDDDGRQYTLFRASLDLKGVETD